MKLSSEAPPPSCLLLSSSPPPNSTPPHFNPPEDEPHVVLLLLGLVEEGELGVGGNDGDLPQVPGGGGVRVCVGGALGFGIMGI